MNRIVPAVILLLAVSWVPAQQVVERGSPGEEFAQRPSRSAEDLDRLRFAASQDEIITVLLEQGRVDQIVVEFERILQLGLKGEDEELVVKSAWRVVERLRERRHFAVAHQVVDATLEAVESNQNKYSLYMLKGKTYLAQRLYQDAIRAHQMAQAFLRGNNN